MSGISLVHRTNVDVTAENQTNTTYNLTSDRDLIKKNSTNDCGLSSCSFSVSGSKDSPGIAIKNVRKCCLHHPCACLRLATPQRGLPGQHPTKLQPQSYVKLECVTKSTKVSSLMQRINPTTQMLISTHGLHGFSMVSLNQLKAFLEIEHVLTSFTGAWSSKRFHSSKSNASSKLTLRKHSIHNLRPENHLQQILGNQKCSQSFGKKGGCSLTSSPWKRQSNGSTLQEL